MTRTSLRGLLRLGLGLGVLLASFGCAKEKEPIVRVQPNALDKTFFVGDLSTPKDDPEFYWRGYVTDGSATQEQIGVGSWSHVDRIRWEITETQLIARKAYPLFFDPLVANDPFAGPDSKGTVVAKYNISSHFDIRRAYNSSTGEEMNLIEENTTDRPWYQRQYMRVDWSSNIVDDPMWFDMFLGKAFGEIKISPLVYNVTDPTSPDAPHFEADQGYFDITNRYYLETAQTPLWGWSIPTCYLMSIFTASATYDCDPQEATVRFSYWKVDPNHDFEPLENTRAALDIVGNPGGLGDSFEVGIVTAPRQGFDPSYGFTDKNYHRLTNIHNIWQQSHQAATCTAKGDANGDGTDDQCANDVTGYNGNSGSQCDVFTKKCTIPYRDRQIKTVGYWVNDLMPCEFQDPLSEDVSPTPMTEKPDCKGTRVGDPNTGMPIRGASEQIIESWDMMFRVAAAYAREVECRRTGDDARDACHSLYFTGEKKMVPLGSWLVETTKDEIPVLTMCHNPVREYDNIGVCGQVGYRARTGDIRRNMMVYWPYESRAPWGGIANWNGDPLTGEIIGAMALTMGRSTRYGAAFARDVLMVAMGELTMADIVEGTPQNTYWNSESTFKSHADLKLSQKEIDNRVKAVDAKHAADTMGILPLYGATMGEKMSSFAALKGAQIYDPKSEAAALARFDSLSSPLIGTTTESALTDANWMRDAMGMSPNTNITPDMRAFASPLQMMDPGRARFIKDSIRTRLEQHGACFMNEDAPLIGSINIPGLATYFKNKFPGLTGKALGEAIYRDILPETYMGIELHEVGHSLGMLHQFASSWDSPNYIPQYWQLRTADGTATASCEGVPRPGGVNDPDTCMGPRYLDGHTADELGLAGEPRPGIEYFGSTSTMEYQWERFGESAGLGPYDLYTMKTLYGRVLETFDDREMPVATQETFAPRMRTQLNEQDMVMGTSNIGNGVFAQPVHYTELARRMNVFNPNRCRDATPEEKAVGKWRIVHGKVCGLVPKDHAAWQDFLSDTTDGADPEAVAPFWHTPKDAKKGNGNVRWFYRWGSTNNSFMHTNPSDAGADPYEVAVATRLKFEAMYPFGYFRRHNREFMDFFLPSRVAETYFDRVRAIHYQTATRAAQFQASFPAQYADIAKSDDWLRPYLQGGVETFNMLYRAVVVPQPGILYNGPTVGRGLTGWQKNAITDFMEYPGQYDLEVGNIAIGYGRFVDTAVDSTPTGGGDWNYNYWVRRSGFEVEKAYAMALLCDGRPAIYTPSRALFLDPRIQSVNFYSDMPLAMDRLVRGILSEDWETVGPDYRPDGTIGLYDITAPNPGPRDAASYVVFPNIGFNQQSYASIFAAMYSRETGDMTLMNKMRIWIEGVDGNIGGTGFPDPAQQQRLFNPLSGFTYIARKFGPDNIADKTVDKGVGASMLQYANWLAAGTWKVEGGKNAPVFDQYGQVKFLLDANGDVQLIAADPASTKLSAYIKYVGIIDGMRQIGLYLGGGPL
ncbi:MAG: hypothetical protein HY898_08345 [Deltaproteobacteria bacterium]|nr:hypothetical protein [Deltaproteobacteria bacterium]